MCIIAHRLLDIGEGDDGGGDGGAHITPHDDGDTHPVIIEHILISSTHL